MPVMRLAIHAATILGAVSLTACGNSSLTSHSHMHSQGPALFSPSMPSITLTESDKALLRHCVQASGLTHKLAQISAQMACYGGSAEAAELKAIATFPCQEWECAKEISFQKTGFTVKIALSIDTWRMSQDSEFSPTPFASDNFVVMLGFGVSPPTFSKSTKCIPYTEMPTWPLHMNAVQTEFRQACSAWLK
jgi:hypothetical protein